MATVRPGTKEETKASENIRLLRLGKIPVFFLRVTRTFRTPEEKRAFEKEIETTLRKYRQLDSNLKVTWDYQSGDPGVALVSYSTIDETLPTSNC